MSSTKRTTLVTNFLWRFFERIGATGVEFLVQIVLARLLTPQDYGIVGIITVFIAIANVFVMNSFSQALVQKLNADNKDFSSVFYINVALGVILYIILFFSAPFIADFYNNNLLTPMIRVLALTLIIGSVNSIQQAYVQRTMQFKRFFFSTLIGTTVSAAVGIAMAYMGFGVWALVVQTFTNQLVNTLVLWFTVKWRPELYFSAKRAKTLFSYGWKLLCSSLIDTTYNNLYSLVIGKVFNESELGAYNRGKQFPQAFVVVINSSIQSVIFPVMSELQENKDAVKAMMRKAIRISTFLIFPAMAGLVAVAKPMITILLTEKWLVCVPFLQFSCFTYAFWPIHTANLQAINAVGRSDIYLKLEIIKKTLGVIMLCITIPMGLYAMMIGSCVTTVLSSFINAFPNRKLLNYSYSEQIKDIIPSLVLSLVMCVVVLCISLLDMNVWLTVILQVVVGVFVYVAGAKLLKLDMLDYVLNLVKKLKKGI